ncbi:MAG TPA: AIR synthase-related protein, partial [Spirochaetota bacterium]|nr:AIR synthase-related protein [Spirochaetota bacterium]
TIVVDTTVTARAKRKDIIDNTKIKAGQVIVGLASFGKANFENEYNSGIGSNGLTSARHDLLNKIYIEKYPESFNPLIKNELVYTGKYKVTDRDERLPIDIGKAILSPTRSYAFIIKAILDNYQDKIAGIVHCSGGGQTKCIRFGKNVHYIKDNLFTPPPIFEIIKDSSGSKNRELYSVFNMGHRMELYTDEKTASEIINISKSFGVDAKIVGYIENSTQNRVTINLKDEKIEYAL